MKRIIPFAVLFLWASLAFAQVDPLGAAFIPSINTTCASYPANIWVTDGLTKLYQNTGNVGTCPGAQGNKWITVYGTQNSFADFQVHFHDSGSGTTGYSVTVSSFVQTAPASFTIAAPDATHRDIIPYREAYFNVTTSSQAGQGGTAAYNWNGLPIGKIPDIMIPAIDPYYHQTTNAFPFTIPASQNQSVWVDIHVPPAAPSGYYKGTVTLQTGCPGSCVTLTTLPIILAVWQWPAGGSMPSTATLKAYHNMGDSVACSAFYNTANGAACNVWPGAGGNVSNAEAIAFNDAQTMYLDHRRQLSYQLTAAPSGSNWNSLTVPLLNGTGNTILSGAKLNTLTFSSDSGSLQGWATVLNSGGWFNTTWQYNCDEPPTGCSGGVAGWKNLWSQGQNDKTITPVMPSLSTTSLSRLASGNGSGQSESTMCTGGFNAAIAAQPVNCLQQSIDIMVPNVADMGQSSGGIHRSDYNAFLATKSQYGTPANNPSRQLWSYLACDSTGCGGGTSGNEAQAWAIDTTSVAARVMEWGTFLNQQTGELYYNDSFCWGTSAGGNCAGSGDPWLAELSHGANGDGNLFYPGRQTGTPTGFINIGVTNPVMLPSFRLKLIRDGTQDYELLNVLQANGKGSVATAAINSFITNDGTHEGWPFNNTLAPAGPYTSDLPDAYVAIGTAMHQLTFPAGGSFPWSALCATSRCTDWSNAGVLDPVSGKSEANGGGIPHYTVQSGTTIAAYGQQNNSGKATSNVATMTVTAITTGNDVQASWATAPSNLVTLTEGATSGTYAGQGCPCIFTRTSGDALNTSGDWVGKTLWLTTSGTPRGAIVSAVSSTQVTFSTQPQSVGGSNIPDGATAFSSTQTFSTTISSVNTVPPTGSKTFTVASTPTIAVGGYSFAGAGDVTTINTAISTCSSASSPASPHYVQLGAGTFNLTVSPNMVGIHDCVLRGAGADQTIINYVASGNNCGGFPAGICFADASTASAVGAFPESLSAGMLPGGANDAVWTGAATTSTVTAGTYTPGSTWITLTNVGAAGGGIHNGQVLNLDQEDGSPISQAGYEYCTRLGSGNFPPSSCNQEPPFSGRGGRRRGTITLAATTGGVVNLTVTAGSNFVTGGSMTNQTIYIGTPPGAGPYNISGVSSTTAATLTVSSTGSGAPSAANCNSSTEGITYVDTTAALYYVCNVNSVWASVANGSYPFTIGYRGQTQVVTVTGLDASCTTACTGLGPFTLKISDPLIGQNWSSTLIPAAWFPTGHPAASTSTTGVNAGVEDLTIDQAFNTNITATSVGFVSINNAWVKGIRSLHGDRSHIAILYSNHISMVNNYLVATKGASTQSYGNEQDASSLNLFENNICNQIVACMIPVGDSGSVFAYNFSMDNYVQNKAGTITQVALSGTTATFTYTGTGGAIGNVGFTPASVAGVPSSVGSFFNITNVQYATDTGTAFTVPTTSLSCTPSCPTVSPTVLATPALLHVSNSVMSGFFIPHGDGNRYLLFEGNIGNQFHPDTIHGMSRTLTANRNYLGGNEKNISQDLWPIRIESIQRYHNFYANVLGSSVTAGYNNYLGCSSGCTGSNWAYFWSTANVTEDNNTINPESLGQSTSMRWGNYDINTLSTRFVTTEVPISDLFGYAQTVPTCTTVACLPLSFWRTSGPAFFNTQFGTVPYPPIGPDVVGGTAMAPDMTGTTTPPGGHAFDNAASLVWQRAPIDPAYVGFDGGVRLFNELMYTASSGAAATLLPNPLAFGNQNINTTSPVSFVVFSNTGSANVTVSGITVTGHFSQSGGSCTVPITIAPGNNCNIGITFSPNATGPFTGTVSVTSNAVPSPTVANLTGTGTQATITWSSPQGGTAYNFGNIPVGTSVNSSPALTLTNTGTGPLTVTPTIGGANPAQFSIISNTCPGSLGAGLSCTFVVRFTATAATTYTASLIETDPNASNSPQSLTMSGSGFIPVVNPVVPWPPIILSP